MLQDAGAVGVPSEVVPVCADNGDYFRVAPTGEVVFWSQHGVTRESWPNLATSTIDVWVNGN